MENTPKFLGKKIEPFSGADLFHWFFYETNDFNLFGKIIFSPFIVFISVMFMLLEMLFFTKRKHDKLES